MIEGLKDRLVYEDRIANVKGAVKTFKDRSAIEAIIGLHSGFGHANRKLLGM